MESHRIPWFQTTNQIKSPFFLVKSQFSDGLPGDNDLNNTYSMTKKPVATRQSVARKTNLTRARDNLPFRKLQGYGTYAKWLQNLKHSDSSGRRARTIHLGTAKGTALSDFFWGKKIKTQVRLPWSFYVSRVFWMIMLTCNL